MQTQREQQSLLGAQQRFNGAIVVQSNNEEKTPFMAEPVRLTPAWEENNLPNDELNFKGMTMERAKMELHPPVDRFKLVFFILMLHGIGTLMPWNMFITAKSYFVDYKMSANYTGVESSYYATNFVASLGFASQIPNLLFNWLNIFVRVGGNLTKRIVYSILIEVFVFIVTVALAMINSSQWPGEFFWLTMATVVILNMAAGIYQNTVYGMVAKLPIKYTGAVVLGSNISGTFTSIVNLLSTLFISNVRTSAIYYFITAMFVLFVCFDTYFALPLNKFYRYHEMLAEKEAEKHKLQGYDANARPPYFTIFRQAFPQLFNIFMVFFVTLAIFPAVHSDVKRSDPNFFVPDKVYVDVLCFLTFNFFAMVGSLTTSFVQWPKPDKLVWPVLLRILFIPFFLFCNYQPLNISRILPIYIKNDWIFWAGGILMGWSSGYLSTLGMMYAPQKVDQKHAVTAGMFAAAMLITGIFSGILTSMLFPIIVQWEIFG